MNKLFKDDLIFLNVDVESDVRLFREVVPILIAKGYVTDGYLQALITREEEYPTGLPTMPFGVAIPHADTRYVKQSGIAVVKPMHPVTFREMGSVDGTIEAKFVFILILDNGESHIDMLQKMMDLFMDEEKMNELVAAMDKTLLLRLLNKYIKK